MILVCRIAIALDQFFSQFFVGDRRILLIGDDLHRFGGIVVDPILGLVVCPQQRRDLFRTFLQVFLGSVEEAAIFACEERIFGEIEDFLEAFVFDGEGAEWIPDGRSVNFAFFRGRDLQIPVVIGDEGDIFVVLRHNACIFQPHACDLEGCAADFVDSDLFPFQILGGFDGRTFGNNNLDAAKVKAVHNLNLHAFFNRREELEIAVHNGNGSIVQTDFSRFCVCGNQVDVKTFLGKKAFFIGDVNRRAAQGAVFARNVDFAVFVLGGCFGIRLRSVLLGGLL